MSIFLQRYEEWKEGLPDFKWVDDLLPDTQKWSKFTNSLAAIKESVRDSIELGRNSCWLEFFYRSSRLLQIFSYLDPRLKQLGENKMDEWRRWFDSRLDNAIEAASTQQNPDIERMYYKSD